MHIPKISIKKINKSGSKYRYILLIDGNNLEEIIDNEYMRRKGESPINGYFITGFNRSLLTYSILNDQISKRRACEEIRKDIDSLIITFGRAKLIVCAECKDIGCGLISAEISKSEDIIVWSKFAYQTSDELEDIDVLKNLTFRFEIDSYNRLFEELRDRITEEF
ncbi:hypothetical protein OKW21_005537 [Catalinimonas alkaloidigena]|uniref:hypothetical protein n=1 Tax=Catalinimonas alkaloidigena TaxID=1075417 RepID=UPI002404E6A6|nr:hypothetical protein [Catalinimonas alkaloidigena]MDF9800274.1 hypothetical protein [Catalinimonas alkaloidigena]